MSKEIKIKNNEIKEGKEERFMEGKDIGEEKVIKKKRGRKKKEGNEEEKKTKDKNKFFIDVSKEIESKELICSLLDQSNLKTYGVEITLKDLVVYSLSKLNTKDIEKLQDLSLTPMQRVQRTCDDYNKKNSTNYELGEFLVKIRKIE